MPTDACWLGAAFRLLGPLGRGAFGEVWAAAWCHPSGFQQPVAIKVLHPGATRERRTALAREVDTGLLVRHPNVLRAHAMGSHGAHLFAVMDLVRGPTLAHLARHVPLTARAVAELGVQLCSGLGALHGHGLVHCDVKPGNVLLDLDGGVVLGDLGLVSPTGRPCWSPGTPRYASLEQRELRPVEPPADLFALGATLDAVVRANATRDLSRILHRCLAPMPEERWPDAQTLGQALDEVARRRPHQQSLADALAYLRADHLEREVATRIAAPPTTLPAPLR